MFASLWIFTTIAAAAAQATRNALQRGLTVDLGTLGATHVRFLFGLPFAILFLVVLALATGDRPKPQDLFWLWAALGGIGQILATACMLHAMRDRSFLVTIAYTKTEPVQVALFSLALLGEVPSALLVAAIAVATLGVMILSWPKSLAGDGLVTRDHAPSRWERLRPAVLGIASGGFFGIAAVFFKATIRAADSGGFIVDAATALVASLAVQTAILTLWIAVRSPRILIEIVRRWRPSLAAGFLGAFASQMWFVGFATAPVAAVRTLGLVEILFAQALSRGVLKERPSRRDLVGVGLLILGVALVLRS